MIKVISQLTIICTFVSWIVWDIYAVINGGVEATLSNVITEFSWYSPPLPFVFGVLIGHWLFTPKRRNPR